MKRHHLLCLNRIIVILTVTLFAPDIHAQGFKPGSYPIKNIDLRHIKLTDNFWLPKIRQIQEVTIPVAFERCEAEGRFENFLTAERVMKGGTGKVRGKMPFDDTDVYKIIEGASLSLVSAPNAQLAADLDKYIAVIARGQEPDGYLTTWRTIDPTAPPADWVANLGGDGPCKKRWDNLGGSHELYNAGHLYEAAAAHFYATGKRNFLNIALKNADLLVEVFGKPDNFGIPGHQIVETGLIKLYQITGKVDYLNLAKKFLDLRGDSVHRKPKGDYWQDHQPILKQDEVVGHAVRAVYMYAGMTDIAAILGDVGYRNAIQKLWDNMVNRKMYVTGGLGARHSGEAFGANYELPNLTAYNETCAAIGGVMWADRMFRLFGEADYYNVLERMLYNAVLPGISLDGTCFFYPNPLESDGKYKFNQGYLTRAGWFDCSCCPTNLIRFLPALPTLIYDTQDQNVYVNLFMGNEATLSVNHKTVFIKQITQYPLDGNVAMEVSPEKKTTFTLKIRIPDWATNRSPSALYHYENKISQSYQLSLNGKQVVYRENDGYIEIHREWTKGDQITLQWPMEVRQLAADPRIKDDVGKTAIAYGPLVYCAEQMDNNGLFDTDFKANNFQVRFNETKMGGINEIMATGGTKIWNFIPYYTWSNRGIGAMKVWLQEAK